jgi:hypothetical protein
MNAEIIKWGHQFEVMWGVYEMLVRRNREAMLKKKAIQDNISSSDNVQSMKSWIRKIEQSTLSVSSRLSAVETRLSGGVPGSGNTDALMMSGPVSKLILNKKRKNASEIAQLLDGELTTLHHEVVHYEQKLEHLTEQLGSLEQVNTMTKADIQTIHTLISQMNSKLELGMDHFERREPFVMRLKGMEIPIEFTGIIGGLLAFLVALLVIFNQKAVLLSPLFLGFVGVLLIVSALLKMVRTRSHANIQPYSAMPLKRPTAQIIPVQTERKEG